MGDNGYRDYANEIVAEADLLFYMGNKTGSVTTIRWTLPDHERPPRIIQLDIDPQLIGNNYPTEVGLVGDAKLILADLVALRCADAPRGRARQVAERIAGLRAAWWGTQAAAMESDQSPIKPHRVMAALQPGPARRRGDHSRRRYAHPLRVRVPGDPNRRGVR